MLQHYSSLNLIITFVFEERSSPDRRLQSTQFFVRWEKGQATQCIVSDQGINNEGVTVETAHSKQQYLADSCTWVNLAVKSDVHKVFSL